MILGFGDANAAALGSSLKDFGYIPSQLPATLPVGQPSSLRAAGPAAKGEGSLCEQTLYAPSNSNLHEVHV